MESFRVEKTFKIIESKLWPAAKLTTVNHIPKCKVCTCLLNTPGDTDSATSLGAVPMPHNPFAEESFANTQSKPPLLETISSCPISFHLGEETPRLAQGSSVSSSSWASHRALPSPELPELLGEAPGEVARQSYRLLFTLPANWDHLQDHCLSNTGIETHCRAYQLRRKKNLFSCVSSVWKWFIHSFTMVITLFI